MLESLKALLPSPAASLAIYGISGMLSLYWLALSWRLHQKRRQPLKMGPSYPPLTLLSAIKEESALRPFLQTLARLSYPAPWEVVIALHKVALPSTLKPPIPVRWVHIPETPPGWSPKKYALAQALAHAQYEWVVILDADVQVPPDFLQMLMWPANLQTAAILALGWLRPVRGLASLAAAWESNCIQLEGLGRAAWGFPYLSTGRGWAVRKAWLMGGLWLWKEVLSGDDDLTLQLIPSKYVAVSIAETFSPAPEGWRSYLKRKWRHLQTAPHYSLGLRSSLALPPLAYALLWLCAFIAPKLWLAPLVVWMSRFLALTYLKAPGPVYIALTDPLQLLLSALYPLLAYLPRKKW